MTVVDAPPAAPARPAGASGARPGAGTLAVVAGCLLGLLLLALAVGGAAPASLVDGGVPVARLAGRIAAVGTVGSLLFAAVLQPAAPVLTPASRRALRAASAWATAWAAATAVHALLALTQLVGAPTPGALWTFATDLPGGRAAVVVVGAAALVAGLARRSTGRAGAAVLLAVAVTGLVVPAVLTGHSAGADHHLVAVTTLSVHVVAATVWVGGLLALLAHGRGRHDLAPAAARFSVVALACFLATAASGLLAARLLVGPAGPAAVVGTGFGWLLAAKTAALLALGLAGLRHRARTLPRLRAGVPGSFRRFAVVETGVMLATVALAVALAASPPPAATAAPPPAPAPQGQGPGPGLEDMSGHDHGELSVGVLIDASRFHVSGPVEAGSLVTVHNATPAEVTITAGDGSFDVVVPGHALMTFPAPEEPGSYRFASRHSPAFTDVLLVR